MSALRRHTTGEDGASAIEFAILAPLVLAIAFGILSGGMAWNTKQTLTHATREAVRFAATKGPLPTTEAEWDTWLSDVKDRALESSFGELNEGQPGRQVCVSFTDGSDVHRLVIQSDGSQLTYHGPFGSTNDTRPCFGDGIANGEPRTQALIRRQMTFIAVLINPTLPIEARAVARYEVAGA